MATAVDAVFDTAELLEAILSQLNPKDLLLSQRVGKTWKLAIAGSRGLQEKLFLRRIGADHAPEFELYCDLYMSPLSCSMSPICRSSAVLRNTFMRGGQIDGTNFPASADPKFTPSWRDMLVSQPAPDKVTFFFSENLQHFDTSITNTNGIRLGQVLDELEALRFKMRR